METENSSDFEVTPITLTQQQRESPTESSSGETRVTAKRKSTKEPPKTISKRAKTKTTGQKQLPEKRPVKKKRAKPGVKALREIRQLQKSFDLLIPKLPFARVVKQLGETYSRKGLRWQAEALMALQEAAEAYLVKKKKTMLMHKKKIYLFYKFLLPFICC